MSSSEAEQKQLSSPDLNSVQQKKSDETVQMILTELNTLCDRLNEVIKPKEEVGAGEERKEFEKVWKELKAMVREFEKLKKFEDSLTKPLETLQRNVDDILNDLNLLKKSSSVSKGRIEHNVKVLRSNITKVKIQIPLQHQASKLISDASRYLQATVASREEGDLPNLYGAAKILEIEGSFYKEIQHKYDNLNDDALKLCLLCFAIFPENAEIKKSLLKFWWLGERIMNLPGASEKKKDMDRVKEDMDRVKKDMDRVNHILGVLMKEGFIEPVKKKSRVPATRFKMHPVVRSLLIRRAKEANFFDYDSNGDPAKEVSLFFMKTSSSTVDISMSRKACLIKTERPQPQQQANDKEKQEGKEPEEQRPQPQQKANDKEKQPTSPENLNLENQGKEKKQPTSSENLDTQPKEKQQLKYLEELQTLFNISKQFPDLPEELFSKMKNIRVLYLGRWESTAERHMEVESTKFLEKGLVNMHKLRFFSLQGISGISKLPESIGKLINLRILDLRACHNLEELPKELSKLKQLAYLDISECYLIDNMPKGLASLLELQVLKGFVISKNKRSCTLGKLAKLPKLKKLTINVNSDEFSIDEAEKDLCKFKSLRKLRIAWGALGERSSNENKDGKKGNGSQENNGDKSRVNKGNKDGKKGNGSQENNGDKSKVNKGQESGAAKSGFFWMKKWGASKSTPEKKVTAPTEKSKSTGRGEIERKTNGGKSESSEGKKQLGSDAAKSMATNLTDNEAGKEEHERSAIGLKKLDLQCFPGPKPPNWLVPEKLGSLKSLYIRGGRLSYLSDSKDGNQWQVENLRLKYLTGVQITWKDLQTRFPHLKYLERVDCPGITFCPGDANGVWGELKKNNKNVVV